MRKERRRVAIRRRTRGTDVEVELRLDGAGRAVIETPYALLNDLLDILVVPSGMDLRLVQSLNKHADDPYAIDDLASALAEAFRRLLGPRPRIRQFGSAILPVGDALVLAAVDLVSPPVFQFGATFRHRQLAGMDIALVERFLATFADRLGASIHIRILSGAHDENRCRAIFAALGRALAEASTEVEREGAREFAAEVDYLEGIPRPPAGPAGLDEAVVEELVPAESAEEFEEVGLPDEPGAGRERRLRRSSRGGRGDRVERSERMERAERGDRLERTGRAERGEPAGRAERGEPAGRAERGELAGRAERGDRGERRDRRPRAGRTESADLGPARGEERQGPAEEAALPELPAFPDFDFEPAVSDEMGEAEPGRPAGEGADDEVHRRRRRRGRRGGRGRHRADERAGGLEAEGDESAGSPLAEAEPAPPLAAGALDQVARERPGTRPWLRGWEEEPAAPARERESFEAPDLEPGEPSALRAAGRPTPDAALRFGRRSSRLPRPGEAPESAAPPASAAATEAEHPARAAAADIAAAAPAPDAAAPAADGVLDFITKKSEAKAAPGAKTRRRRR